MVKFKAIGVSEGLAKAKALVIKEEDLSVVKETVADAEAECKAAFLTQWKSQAADRSAA